MSRFAGTVPGQVTLSAPQEGTASHEAASDLDRRVIAEDSFRPQMIPKHDEFFQDAPSSQVAKGGPQMQGAPQADLAYQLRKDLFETGKQWAANRNELAEMEKQDALEQIESTPRQVNPDPYRARSLPDQRTIEQQAKAARKAALKQTLEESESRLSSIKEALKESRDGVPPSTVTTKEGADILLPDGSYLLPNGRRARLEFGSDKPSPSVNSQPIEAFPPVKPEDQLPITGGISGSGDIRFAKPESQKPWQPSPKSRDELDEEKRIRTELLPFVLDIGSQISEAEREKRHEALLGMVAEKEQTIKALRDLNKNLDPFSEAHRVNDALRWEEERRHTGMQRVVKDLERYIAKEYPGTTLSDKLYQRHHKDRLTRKQQERADERAATIAEFQKYLRESGQAPNMLETFLAQTAGNVKHTAAGAWEFMGGDARELRESADDNQVFANTREGVSGAILRGAGDVVGTLAGSPSGKVGWALSTVRGLANGYSQTLAETGDREEAKRALIAEAPWLAVYAVAGKVGAKGGKLLLPKNPGPLLKSAAAFGGEAISSISVGTVRSIVEGKEYGLQQLTADTLIAYFQARGSYKSETTAAGKEAAKQELLKRGFSEEQIATPFEPGPITPAEIINPASPDEGNQLQGKARGRGKHLTSDALQAYAHQYAELVNSNKYWEWDLDIKDGSELTQRQKTSIKLEAIRLGFIANIKRKPGTKYADFEGAGVVQKTLHLPKEFWKLRDDVQFEWLDSQLPGGRPPGTTWHHSEISGKMELVPYGLHRIFGHWGGRSKGNWSEGPR